jgi:hypothetical protein
MASIILLLAAMSQRGPVAQTANKPLKYNTMCLHEMAQAWSWSLRVIGSLQILAEDWLELTKTDSPNFTNAQPSNPASQGKTPSNEKRVLDWLLDIDIIMPFPSTSLMFDQHIWPVGFSLDALSSNA